jgi:hypothetical protein
VLDEGRGPDVERRRRAERTGRGPELQRPELRVAVVDQQPAAGGVRRERGARDLVVVVARRVGDPELRVRPAIGADPAREHVLQRPVGAGHDQAAVGLADGVDTQSFRTGLYPAAGVSRH